MRRVALVLPAAACAVAVQRLLRDDRRVVFASPPPPPPSSSSAVTASPPTGTSQCAEHDGVGRPLLISAAIANNKVCARKRRFVVDGAVVALAVAH